MSLDHFDDRRKALTRRQKEMAKAAKIVGPKVRNLAVYDETPDKRVELAKLLARNVENPGFLGAFIEQAEIVDDRGRAHKIVRKGNVKDAVMKWTLEHPNLTMGWKWDDMATAFSIASSDKRLERIFKGVTAAFAKIGFVAERFQGEFRVMTKPELLLKQASALINIQGHAKSRAKKGKALGGHTPMGKHNVELEWWKLPLFEGLGGEE